MLHTYPYPALNIHADSDPGGHRIMHTDPIPGCLLTRGETKKNVVHLLLLDQQKLAAWLIFLAVLIYNIKKNDLSLPYRDACPYSQARIRNLKAVEYLYRYSSETLELMRQVPVTILFNFPVTV